MKKLSNTEAELKKDVAYKKKRDISWNLAITVLDVLENCEVVR